MAGDGTDQRVHEAAYLPPVNVNSSLVAPHSMDRVFDALNDDEDGFADTSALHTALSHSQQMTGSGGSGMRRATSAPHSMDLYVMMYATPAPVDSPSRHALSRRTQQYLSPSGSGPMRRVASSLGMRRSSSFLWTPSAHHDFERAIGFLSSRGAAVSPAAIAQLMATRHVDLKVADVDRHMRKKFIVQRRVMQQLLSQDALSPAAPASALSSTSSRDAHGRAPDSPPTGSRSTRNSRLMEAVEEETALTGCAQPMLAGETLGQQLERQRSAHRQLTVMHAQMQLGEEEI
uniref:Uncharacterized protein n=1 Tax=Chrysotila carterae TaxID=13221 RepID=A0A7S4ES07_CHRCT